MPLVFVHGVNVRYAADRDPHVAARDAMFREFALPRIPGMARDSAILNPYWGGDAAQFPYKHGGLPTGTYESFGADDAAALEILRGIARYAEAEVEAVDPDQVLLTAARYSLADVVDALWVVAAQNLTDAEADALARLAGPIAAYIEANPGPAWLQEVSTDAAFVDRLLREAGLSLAPAEGRVVEAFGGGGIGDRLRRAIAPIRKSVVALRDKVSSAVGRAKEHAGRRVDELLLRVRSPIHGELITFLGDVFVYLDADNQRPKIAAIVGTALRDGSRVAREKREPLVVVAHSMGGNITYDLLTSTHADIPVDVYVTVGSQVAVFEELRLFEQSRRDIPGAGGQRVARPANVKRWVNVFDTADILGFAAERVFDGVEDFRFRTGRLWAHGGYFVEPMFHQRLGARLGA